MSRRKWNPAPARTQQNCEAWWYGGRGEISIFIKTVPNGPTVTCSISTRSLRAMLKRYAPDKEPTK